METVASQPATDVSAEQKPPSHIHDHVKAGERSHGACAARLAVIVCRVSQAAALGLLLLIGTVGGQGGHGLAAAFSLNDPDAPPRMLAQAETNREQDTPDLSGTWEIHEEDRTYIATLDAHGNGPYTHQGGSFTTTDVTDRVWSGTWTQTGNDREGGFEVRLSEDGLTAEGDWWYTRVGFYAGIPPRFQGGSYFFKRLHPPNAGHAHP